MGGPLAKRLVVVTGKGGVGKTTVAAALGLAAARRGLTTIVAEVGGRAEIAPMLGVQRGSPLQEIELRDRLHHVSIARRAATEEYLREETPGPLPSAILARSRAFELFVAATPGLAEMLTVGKSFELTRRPRRMRDGREYDLVILDAPASGHASALLSAPATFAEVARVGPVARQAREIHAMLCDDAHTGVVIVTTGEQMAVSETLQLRDRLRGEQLRGEQLRGEQLRGEQRRGEQLRMSLDAVIANRVLKERFGTEDLSALASAGDLPAVRSALWLQSRARSQRAHLRALRRRLGEERWVTLPFLFGAELGGEEVERLAGSLGERLG